MPNDTRQQCRSICAVDSGKDAIEKVIEKARERYCANRREFTIRLRRLKPRTPISGGLKILEVKTISSISVNIIFVFLIWFNPRFYTMLLTKDLHTRMSAKD